MCLDLGVPVETLQKYFQYTQHAFGSQPAFIMIMIMKLVSAEYTEYDIHAKYAKYAEYTEHYKYANMQKM